MKRKRAGYFWAFVDMLAAMLATYAALFILSVMQIHPAESKPGVEMKAEFLVTLTWPQGNLDDIDLHLLLPDRKMVNFRAHDQGWALLDHDDIGVNGFYFIDGAPKQLEHKEVISIRAIVPGTYVANVHVYRHNESYADMQSNPALPFPVHVKLTKLNPQVQDVSEVDVMLSSVGEQKTAFAFDVRANGDVSVDTTADRPFIPTIQTQGLPDAGR